jgi:integrase
MRAQLNKRLVAGAEPRERPYEIRDTTLRGLLLRVQPSGHKAWIIEWGRGKRRTIGDFGHLTLDQARAHAARSMAEVIQQGLPSIAKPKVKTCTLEQFLSDHYSPWAQAELKCGERYVQRIRKSFQRALSKRLDEIDAGFIDRWWTDRLSSRTRLDLPVTKATVSRDFACLRSALSKAVDWGLLERNPLLALRQKSVESRKVVRFLSPNEESRLRSALSERDQEIARARASGNAWRAARGKPTLSEVPVDGFGDHLTPIVLLAINTGLRRGELLSLRWTDVDLMTRMITIRPDSAKNGRQRHVPLNDEAFSVLIRWSVQVSRAGRIFQPKEIKTAWMGLLRGASINDFRFHDLRHHFASKLVMKGVDLNTVRELLGHADITMTLRYAHLGPHHLAAAVAKLSPM